MKKYIVTKIIFLILLVISLCLWLINLEFAIKLFRPEFSFVHRYIPSNLLSFFETISADLSTVTTLIPVLICIFPLISLKKYEKDVDFVVEETFPYPDNFPFFLVMLGLAGTLYGLLIGLDSSGLTALESETSGAPEIRDTIDRLLDGTATALLSSLVGIVGAFIVVKPIPMIFHGLLHIKVDEEDDIEQVIENLTSGFNKLNKVVTRFSETISKYNDTNIPQCVQNMEKAFFQLLEQQSINAEFLENIHKQQELTNTLLEPLGHLDKLSTLTLISTKLDQLSKIESINDKLDRLQILENVNGNLNEQLELAKENTELMSKQKESTDSLKISVEKIPSVITQILKQDKEFHEKINETNKNIINGINENDKKNDIIISVLKTGIDDKQKQRNRLLKNIRNYLDSFTEK